MVRVERLRRIRVPTLVIHGADDPLVPVAAGEHTAQMIPGAKLEIVQGMGHDLPPRSGEHTNWTYPRPLSNGRRDYAPRRIVAHQYILSLRENL